MKKYCLDCKKEIFNFYAIRCKSCDNKKRYKNPKNNPNYKDGRALKQYYCIDCGKKISFSAKKCLDCYIIWLKNNCKLFNRKSKKGKNSPNYKIGKPKCKNCRKELSRYDAKRCRECYRGKLHHRFIHGNGYKPYPADFTTKLKKEIIKRDNYKCTFCGMTKKEHYEKYNRNLEVHHKNGNKQDCRKCNLKTVCKSCNLKHIL